jgi:putative tryptophan/tyrosine transport system substrate-binding protein
MKRREFIAGLSGTAVWPVVARAQHNEAMKRVAILMGGTENANYQGYVAAFRQGLADVNWREGRSIRVDVYWGNSDAARIDAYAAELVGLVPDVILATNTPTARALKRATETICREIYLCKSRPGMSLSSILKRRRQSA